MSLFTGDALDDFDLSGEKEDSDEDEEDDSQEGSIEDAEEDATDAKRAGQASGAHPLQQRFKAAAGELLKKYGMAPDDTGALVFKGNMTRM